jgi:hypothetical protein
MAKAAAHLVDAIPHTRHRSQDVSKRLVLAEAAARVGEGERQAVDDAEALARARGHLRGRRLPARRDAERRALRDGARARAEDGRERDVRVRRTVERPELEVGRAGARRAAQPHGRLARVAAPGDVRAAGEDAVVHARVRRRGGERERAQGRQVREDAREEVRLDRVEVLGPVAACVQRRLPVLGREGVDRDVGVTRTPAFEGSGDG